MSSDSTFKLRLKIARKVRVEDQKLSRDDFSSWLWAQFQDSGLLGIHEGTMLSEDAAEQGLETESWTVDAGEAPRERDWIEGQDRTESELFFDTEASAQAAAKELARLTDVEIGEIAEQPQEDWDAKWKASFLGAENGFQVPPFWHILPPWVTREFAGEVVLKINPGAGFGTGTHETTQLCLESIGEISRKRSLALRPVLDFGSGSGILSIAAALLGARVDGVEIDPLAIDNAVENAAMNGVSDRVSFSKTLSSARSSYDLVIANILRPVLIEFSDDLVARMAPGASLVLSGLIERDVPEVRERFSALLGGLKPLERELGEWRALVWTKG
ncbi:MAG: 50S ribosomal protein L11 methyltransferase [Oligoflexia bacterium]|nr:50S ribosomal protein L11 methyltransferase [Oligoflexia bacterium]